MFKGSLPAMVTPFNNGEVDVKGLRKLVNWHIEQGSHGLVPVGTTGESPTLTHAEHEQVVSEVINEAAGRVPVIAGAGSNNTAEAVRFVEHAKNVGADAALVVTPYYNKPTQRGLIEHYKVISSATDLPILLYNVPGRTSSNISSVTTLRLANEISNIVGIKEASGNMEQIMNLIANKPEDFLVISGDDALTLPHIAVGGDGVISVVANAFPKRFSEIVTWALNGNLKLARQKHYELLEIIHYLFKDGNPAGIKYILKLINLCSDKVRLPLVNVSPSTASKLYELVAGIDDTLV